MREANLEEVKSLVGKIDTRAMGAQASKEKLKRPQKAPKKKEQEWSLKGGNLLEENFYPGIKYRPRTQENKLTYENYLGRVQQMVEDQPPETLIGIADQVLAIIRGEGNDASKRSDAERLMGRVQEEAFIDLCNTAKNITDYNLDEEEEVDDIVAVDEELEEEGDEQIVEEVMEEEDQVKEEEQELMVPEEREIEHAAGSKVREAMEDEVSRINKKVIDLTIHDAEDRTSRKQEYRFKLPEGAERIEHPGYEEVHIPPRERVIDEKLTGVTKLDSWMQPVFSEIKTFNVIQSRVLPFTLKNDGNMLVCAPTSAGKTNVALLAILATVAAFRDNETGQIDLKNFKIVYIAPMKALVAEVTGNLSNRLKSLGITVRELTGDVHLSRNQIEETQVIVSTPEKWDIITRKTGERMFVEKVRLVIIDEIHLLSDSRGPVLESVIARATRQNETGVDHTRIVGLSATLPNYKDVAATLRIKGEGLFYFDQSYRPIPLQQRYLGVTEKKGVRKMLMLNEILYEKVMERVGNYSMIIFVHSRRDTVRTANSIKDTAYTKNQSSLLLRPESESKKIIDAIVEKETINSKELKELLQSGIGIHHAGLSRGDRDLVEQLFADRHFNILVSTATLAWGVNLPAHTVIIKGTQVYSPELGRWIELSLQDVMQMLGRAGRPRFDKEGEGIILTGYEEVRYYLSLLNMQIPLQSQMYSALADQLNAEVVQGTVSSVKDAVNWLSYTYLYVRMLRNPRYYSIAVDEIEEDKELLRRRVNLAHTAFCQLERSGLISYQRRTGAVTPQFLGKTASYYYIKHSSMSIYNNNLKSSSSLIDLLRVFAMSTQFKYLAVREEEKNELKKLVESVPVPIRGAVEETTTKIAALLQAHISRLALEGLALNVDKVYITQSAGRIVRALFEICLKKGWGTVAQRALELAKMVDRTMWTCLNPLRQFKNIPEYVLGRLEKKQQFSWESFYQMTPQQIGDLTKFPKLGKILHKFVHHVPRVQLQAYAQPVTRSCLKVDLTARADFRWEDEYHGKEEPFWLLALDCNEETILYSYYFTLSRRNETFSTEFILPLFEVMHPLYFIKVISDRWVCPENVLPLSFKRMVLPSKFAPPHELQDIQPITVSSLDPIARDMKINHLNQVQTQAYHAVVNSPHNVFLGAAEGSGKFTLAVLAASQVLERQKKIVIVVKHEVASHRYQSLKKLFPKKIVAKTVGELAIDSKLLVNADVLVTTPTAWDVLTRRWRSRKGFNEVALVVVDGLHLMGEGDGTLEVVVSRMRIISSQNSNSNSPHSFRLICLSAPLADYTEIADWIGSPPEGTINFHPSVRPNNVEVIFKTFDQPLRESRLHMMQKSLMKSVLHDGRSTLVVVDTQRQAKLTAVDLVSELAGQSKPKRLKKISEKQLEGIAKRIGDQYLLHVIEYGIGYIYEGQSQLERQIMQDLFKLQAITILVTTHTLKWEFDYKVFAVAVLDCCHYDAAQQRWVDYSIPEMMQLMSLASPSDTDRHKGREYQSAKFYLYCENAKKTFYKKFLFEPYPLESCLQLNLRDHLCAAVVAKIVASKSDAVDWITWTFMYRRLICNPSYYNMEDTSEESVSLFLSELVEETVSELENFRCLECVQNEEGEEQLEQTNYAIICSFYYIKVETLNNFQKRITQDMKIDNIFEVLSGAAELEQFQYSSNTGTKIASLLLQTATKPKDRVHGLLLLYLHRIQMPKEILEECRSMVPICLKLTHAMIDVVSSLGYLRAVIYCTQFCQMLVQAMWIHESPLLQVLDRQTVTVLEEQHNIKEIGDFVDMDEDERRKALKGKDIDKVATACNRYPSLNLSANLDNYNQEEAKVKVTLEYEDELEPVHVISNNYPVEKEEYWLVVIGDKKNNRVLSTKRTLVKQRPEKTQLKLDFEHSEVEKVSVYALCDSYVGCDQAEEVMLPKQ